MISHKPAILPLSLSITAQSILQRRNRRNEEILPAFHRRRLRELSQPRVQIAIIVAMHRDVQHPAILRLPNQRVVPRLRRRERFVVRPRPLHEVESVLQARLVAREEETPRVVFVVGRIVGVEFATVGNPVADHAGHFYGVGVCARVHFADVGAEGALEFGDASVAEIVVEFLFCFIWEFGNRSSCRRNRMLADFPLGKKMPMLGKFLGTHHFSTGPSILLRNALRLCNLQRRIF